MIREKDKEKVVQIDTKDDLRFFGKIVDWDEDCIYVKQSDGERIIPRENISSLFIRDKG
jgi:hypothetical protein